MPRALDVLLPLPLAPLRWLAPFGREPIQPGDVVVVPWQGGVRAGLVTGEGEAAPSRTLELKEALTRLDGVPRLPRATLEWILEEAERTVAPPGTVLASLSPAWARLTLEHHVRELASDGGPPGPWQRAERVPIERLELLREQGLLDESVVPERRSVRALVPTHAEPSDAENESLSGAARAPQRSALAELRRAGWVESGAALARRSGVGESPVRTLVRNGFARYETRSIEPPDPTPPPPARPWPDGIRIGVDDGSERRAESDGRAGPDVALESRADGWIAGGSRARRLATIVPDLRRDLARGRSPLVLAPERRWAQEAAAWLANELPVAVLHTDDDPLARRRWEDELIRGSPRVVLGTWPVLATPVMAPGRLVVLEADSETYKLRSGARTWVPAAARTWADRHDVPWTALDVIAGPETRRRAGGDGRTLATARVRWIVSDLGRSHGWPLGDEAVRVLRQVQERDRQALILVPRRGFSAALGCRACGAAVMCPNCDLALRWHARDGRLRCHQCGHDVAPPQVCPSCGNPELEAQRAAGSEWVLRALAGVAPELPRFRYDGDVRDDLSALFDGGPGVVVGTSAVLRLPPLPVLSLILVTQIDGALHADDFRAEERVMRTLAALQETAGSRTPLGMVQTFAPHHPILRAFEEGSPAALERAIGEMDARRRRFGYPPYGRMARVQASARREADAWSALAEIRDRLEAAGARADELLGPAAAPVARVRGRAIAQLLLRTADAARRRSLLGDATSGSFRGVRIRVDVDPRDIGDVLD